MVQPLQNIVWKEHARAEEPVCPLKCRKFICTESPISGITQEEYQVFDLQLQEALLGLLKRRELLTPLEYRHCMEKLERERGGFHAG